MSTEIAQPAPAAGTVAPTNATNAEPVERKVLEGHTTAPWKIGVLALCPARYYLAGVAKDPRRKESGFEAEVGTLLHHAIEQVAYLRTWVSLGRDEALTPDELLRGLDQPSSSKGVERARRNPEALAEARVLAKKVAPLIDMAGLMVETVGTKLRPLVEEPWTLDVGEVDGKRVVVGGIWDFVRRRKGRVVITDWKKGGDVRGSDELRLDAAATLYATAAKARWPKEHVRVEHFYLTKGFPVGIDWTPELDEWARMAALEHARAVLAFEKQGEWPATPSLRACSYCNFRPTCTAFRERVTTGFGLGAFDPSQLGDIEKATLARAKAHEDSKLAERWVEDLDKALEPVIARAAEQGQDELVVAGHVVRRGKRTGTKFPMWRRTIARLWELTGLAPEEVEDEVLSLAIGSVEQLLATRGWQKEDRDRILEVLKNETGEERSSTWIEVRPVADPMPTIDVAAILRLGVKVALPPPAPAEADRSKLDGSVSNNPNVNSVSPVTLPQDTRGEASAGPAPTAAPAPTPEPPTAAAAPAVAAPEKSPAAAEPHAPSLPPSPQGVSSSPEPKSGYMPPSYATCVTCQVNLRAADPNNASGFCESCFAKRNAPKPVASVAAPSPSSTTCACGKSFQNARGLASHRRSCASAKAAAAPVATQPKPDTAASICADAEANGAPKSEAVQ